MQVFDEVFIPIPQAQTQPAYPSAAQQDQYPQPQGQGQYPQPQQPSYPTCAQRSSYPQNYQAPYPGQAYQQQPGGYPNYQAPPQCGVPHQVVNQGQDAVQKQVITQRLNKNLQESGKRFVTLYSLIVAAISIIIMYVLVNQINYQIMLNAYQKVAGRSFITSDTFSRNTCQAFLADIIAVPLYLLIFAIFNFSAMCVSFTGLTCCMFIQPVAALLWAVTAVFAAQQECFGNNIVISMFGVNTFPQNSWPYYAAMAAASLAAYFLNNFWSKNKNQTLKDQRSLALMMAAS